MTIRSAGPYMRGARASAARARICVKAACCDITARYERHGPLIAFAPAAGPLIPVRSAQFYLQHLFTTAEGDAMQKEKKDSRYGSGAGRLCAVSSLVLAALSPSVHAAGPEEVVVTG